MRDMVLGPGDIVAGKYRVEREIGAGGMGYVLSAMHIALGDRVALKLLHANTAKDGEAVARFFREARAASRIKGEHVARVTDSGKLEDGTPYLVMEYLDGFDLSTYIERNGVLSVGVSVDYVLQACEALAEAHALGIVHRDIKPSNLFLTKRVDGSPCVKVLDFGISKAMSPIDATQPDFGMTRTQSVLGSPQYMAPEQMRSSKRVDGRTDIWAIGTIMHELLTGKAPFVAATMPELFAMILTDPTPSLRERRSDVSPELDEVVTKCLEKEPERRYPNILEVARALAPFASTSKTDSIERIARVTQLTSLNMAAQVSAAQSGGHPSMSEVLVAPPLTPSSPLEVAKTTIDPAPMFAPPPSKSRLGLLVGMFGFLAIVGVVLVVLAVTSRPTTASRPSPEPSAVTSVASASAIAAPPTESSAAAAEPPAPGTTPPAASATPSHAATTAKPRATGVRTTASASATTAAPAATAPVTAPPASATKPAPTATSRYD